MRKKLIAVLVILLSFGVLLSAQTTTATTTPTADDPQAEPTAQTEEGDGITNIINSFKSFAPTFPFLKSTDASVDKRDFDMLLKLLDQIENDYLFRVENSARLIIEGYTNTDHTVYSATTGEEIENPNQMQNSNRSNEIVQFTTTQDFFEVIRYSLAQSKHIQTGLNKISQAFEAYDNIKETIKVSSRSNETPDVEYRLHLYNAMFNIFKGSVPAFKIAVNSLNYILDNELYHSDEEKLMINTYLAGINKKLAESNSANEIMKVHYLNEMFDNLWVITEVRNKDDESLKTYKLKYLIKTYYDIVDPLRPNFRKKYKAYFDDLGLKYSETKERMIEKGEKELSEEGEGGTTAPATTTPATTTPETTTGY